MAEYPKPGQTEFSASQERRMRAGERSQAQRDRDALGGGILRNAADSPPSIDLPRQSERKDE